MRSTTADETRKLAHATILKQLAEGVIVTDAIGTIVFVNDAAAAIHGVSRLDVKPNAYSEIYSLFREDGRPYPSHDLPLARAVRGETVKDARWRIRTPDGRDVLAVGTAQPLLDMNGRRLGAVLTIRDETARDAAERKLRTSEMALREADARLAKRGDVVGVPDAAGATRQATAKALGHVSTKIRTPLEEILEHTRRLMAEPTYDSVQKHGAQVRALAAALLSVVESLAEPRGTEAA